MATVLAGQTNPSDKDSSRWEDAVARRIIDISVPLQSDIASDPPGTEPKITYFDHKQSAPQVCTFFPGSTPADLPDGEGWAVERIDISTHNGTHLDAPWHFASTMDKGKRAITIDEVPLEWCFQPGVKLDFRHFPNGYVATPADVEAELKRIGHTLRAARDRRRQHLGGKALRRARLRADGLRHGPGGDALSHLARRARSPAPTPGRGTRPSSTRPRNMPRPRTPSLIWEGHKSGREIGYCHIEKLHNLEALPAHGFTVACFPVKIKAASAGWTRAVAIIEE